MLSFRKKPIIVGVSHIYASQTRRLEMNFFLEKPTGKVVLGLRRQNAIFAKTESGKSFLDWQRVFYKNYLF